MRYMSTSKENSNNNKYVFDYKHGSVSEIIAYRNNLIDTIKKTENARNIDEMQNFHYTSATDVVFHRFVRIAKDTGFHIYELKEI